MTRISLKEAYDNRDIIAMLVNLRDDVDELLNILKDIDPNGDLTNVVTKTGDQIIDGRKTFIGEIVADCDIIQNGAAYETHAELIYSHNDYLIMRDGQLNGLPAGSYSGLQVKKYNGSDDVRMVVDNTGIMRVGDINDEQPLLVRDEASDLSAGDVLLWDSVNQKAIGQAKDTIPTAGSTACVTSDGLRTALDGKQNFLVVVQTTLATGVTMERYGKVVTIHVDGLAVTPGTPATISGIPKPYGYINSPLCSYGGSGWTGVMEASSGAGTLSVNSTSLTPVFGSITYITSE